MAWLRSQDPDQRCRVVIASNPPVVGRGEWLLVWFIPARLADNRYLSDPRYRAHVMNLPERLRSLYGDFSAGRTSRF